MKEPYRSPHHHAITESMRRQDLQGFDPALVEAYMLVGIGTFDSLWTHEQFDREVALGCECITHGGIEDAIALAATYGLSPTLPI